MEQELKARAVVRGVVQFLSVSALQRADARSKGCLRKWYYRYVVHIQDVETKAKLEGIKLHAELHNYVNTGSKLLTTLALKGLHMVPEPGPGIVSELEFGRITAPKQSLLWAGSIPLVGKIDLISTRGVNKGAIDVEDIYDPPGTVEITDWKRTGRYRPEHELQPAELPTNVQMAGYGVFARNYYGDALKHLRLSIGYFPSQGALPHKVTALVPMERCLETWDRVSTLTLDIIEAARQTSPNKVPANTAVCDGAFGGCQHRQYCTAYQKTSLAKLYGEDMSQNQYPPQGQPQQPYPQYAQQPQQGPQQGYPPPGYPPPQYAQQPQQPQQGYPPPAPDYHNQAYNPQQPVPDPRAQLLAEGAAVHAQAQVIPGLAPGTTPLGAWSMIVNSGRGTPAMSGEALAVFSTMPGAQFVTPQGSGDLARVPAATVADVMRIAAEVGKGAPQVQQVLSPQAPQSHPLLATQGLPQVPVMQAEPEKKKRGRKPKAEQPPGQPAQQQQAEDEDDDFGSHHLQFMATAHLKPEFAAVAKPLADFAQWLLDTLPANSERAEVLRLMRRVKDHAITSLVQQ